jgi:hypothetical protein
MSPIIARREEALDLLANWREHSENDRRWAALLELLELRELLREEPEAASSLPAGFDPDQHL